MTEFFLQLRSPQSLALNSIRQDIDNEVRVDVHLYIISAEAAKRFFYHLPFLRA